MKRSVLLLIAFFTIAGFSKAQIIVGKREADKKNVDNRHLVKTVIGKDTLYTYQSDIVGLLPKTDMLNRQQTAGTAQTMSYGYGDLSHIPTSFTFDKSKDVGEIQLIQSDNQDGSLSYQVPIDVYRTGSGLDPNLQLAYNSSGGNGIAGMGWQIGGVSAIVTTGSTTYYDNKISAPIISPNAAFMLDGLRLILKNKNNTTLIWEYESETGNIKVEAQIYKHSIPFHSIRRHNLSYKIFQSILPEWTSRYIWLYNEYV